MERIESILRQLTRRDVHPAVQFLKYALGGLVAATVDVVAFYAAAFWLFATLGPEDPVVRLLGLHIAPIAAGVRSVHYIWDKLVAFVFSNAAAYTVNIFWVFTPGRHGKVKEIALFFAVSGLSFVAGTGLAWFLIQSFAMPTTYAYGANAVASIAINYACRKYLVFKD